MPVMPEACFRHDVKGSVISLGSFFEDHLVERQVRYGLAQPSILLLQLLHPLDLVHLKAAELIASAIIGQLCHANRRIAAATVAPCDVTTSTCRSLATISSGLCLLPISSPPRDQIHNSSRTNSMGEVQGLVRFRARRKCILLTLLSICYVLVFSSEPLIPMTLQMRHKVCDPGLSDDRPWQ